MSPTPSPSLEPPYGDRDPCDMAARIAALPEHIDEALARIGAAPWRVPIANPSLVAVGGMGGSAIAAELTGALGADRFPAPWLVVRDDRWPACVRTGALAVLSSNSGETGETLALAAEVERRAVAAVAITSGGRLADRARANGWPLQHLPGGMPPRAALFHGWVPMTFLPAALGWLPDPAPDWREAAILLRGRCGELGTAVPPARNAAKQLAAALDGRLPLVYAAQGPVSAVAVRWRQQFNENAKVHAHSAAVPELSHNEIVGWQRPAPAHAGVAVVILRDAEDHAESVRRLELTGGYAARHGAAVHEVRSVGASRIARMASLTQFGDYLSLYLALLGGQDPTDIASIDEFKRRMAQAG